MIRFIVLYTLLSVFMQSKASPIFPQQKLSPWGPSQSQDAFKQRMARFRSHVKKIEPLMPPIKSEFEKNKTLGTLGSMKNISKNTAFYKKKELITEKDVDSNSFETTTSAPLDSLGLIDKTRQDRLNLRKKYRERANQEESTPFILIPEAEYDSGWVKTPPPEEEKSNSVKSTTKSTAPTNSAEKKKSNSTASTNSAEKEESNSATTMSPVNLPELFNKISLKHPEAINSFSYSQNESTEICWVERVFIQFDSNYELNHTWVEYEVIFETPSESTDPNETSSFDEDEDLIEVNVLDPYTNVKQDRRFKLFWHNHNTSIWVNTTRRCGRGNHLDKTYRDDLDGSKMLSIRLTNTIGGHLLPKMHSQKHQYWKKGLGPINTIRQTRRRYRARVKDSSEDKNITNNNEGNKKRKQPLLPESLSNDNLKMNDGKIDQGNKGKKKGKLLNKPSLFLKPSPLSESSTKPTTNDYMDPAEYDEVMQQHDPLTPQVADSDYYENSNENKTMLNGEDKRPRLNQAAKNDPKRKSTNLKFDNAEKIDKHTKDAYPEYDYKEGFAHFPVNEKQNTKYKMRTDPENANEPDDDYDYKNGFTNFADYENQADNSMKHIKPNETKNNIRHGENDESEESVEEYDYKSGFTDYTDHRNQVGNSIKRINHDDNHETDDYTEEPMNNYDDSTEKYDDIEEQTSKPLGMSEIHKGSSKEVECPPSFTNMFIKSKFLPHLCNIQVKNKDKIRVRGSFIATKKVLEEVDGKETEVEKPMFEIVENSEIRVFDN